MIVYTRFEDQGISIVIAAEGHNPWDCVPSDAINPREIQDSDIPIDRGFRGAWCDVTPESRIDINLQKAKALQLEKLRKEVRDSTEILEKKVILAFIDQDEAMISILKDRRSQLITATKALEDLVAEGINDETILNEIKRLGTLRNIVNLEGVV